LVRRAQFLCRIEICRAPLQKATGVATKAPLIRFDEEIARTIQLVREHENRITALEAAHVETLPERVSQEDDPIEQAQREIREWQEQEQDRKVAIEWDRNEDGTLGNEGTVTEPQITTEQLESARDIERNRLDEKVKAADEVNKLLQHIPKARENW
jgi:hypothetical protein